MRWCVLTRVVSVYEVLTPNTCWTTPFMRIVGDTEVLVLDTDTSYMFRHWTHLPS